MAITPVQAFGRLMYTGEIGVLYRNCSKCGRLWYLAPGRHSTLSLCCGKALVVSLSGARTERDAA